jgi:hypothetical protein
VKLLKQRLRSTNLRLIKQQVASLPGDGRRAWPSRQRQQINDVTALPGYYVRRTALRPRPRVIAAAGVDYRCLSTREHVALQ